MRRLLVVLIFIAAVSCAIFMGICTGMPFSIRNAEEALKADITSTGFKDKEEAVFKFIQEHMLCDNGEIFTNLKPGKSGFETLSESVGLLMNYCIKREKKELFDKELAFLKKNMMVQETYIKWRYSNEEASCNAAVDDLRIAGALLDAYQLWQDDEYLQAAKAIQQGILDKQTDKSNLYEFYDFKVNVSKKSIPLCYLDIYNIYRMSEFNKEWAAIAENGLELMNKGRIKVKHKSAKGSKERLEPLFYKYYNYQTGLYSKDEEYRGESGVCLTYTIYAALHLAMFNEDTGFFTDWLKDELEKGKLYTRYNPDTMMPSEKMESTAVYALAAVYCKKTGEDELYTKLIDKMLQFMVKDKESTYYGGFGSVETGEFYSFDNLTALWALSME